MSKISKTEAANLLASYQAKKSRAKFKVTFVKRSDGVERTLHGTFKAGSEGSYDPDQFGLLRVFDVQADGFRTIPLDGIKSIEIGGKVYTVR